MKRKLLVSVLVLSLIGFYSISTTSYAKDSPVLAELTIQDSDNDGMPDVWEKENKLNPNNAKDAVTDKDNDGYSNLCEYLHKTNPNDKESIPSANITINVPSDVKTIQEAIDIAIDKDTILVAQGKYQGNINFNGKSITLISTDSDNPNVVANTIIEGTKKGSVVTIDTNSIIKGFTITSGVLDCRGIYIKDASATIESCTIIDNETTGLGGGIFNTANSSPKIINCIITQNKDSSETGESAQVSGGTPEISQSWINGQGLVDNTNENEIISDTPTIASESGSTDVNEAVGTTTDSEETVTTDEETPIQPPFTDSEIALTEITPSSPISDNGSILTEPQPKTTKSASKSITAGCTGIPAQPVYDPAIGAYKITNCDELQGINLGYCHNPNDGDYYLANDIDCSCTRDWNGGAGFSPMGDFIQYRYPFIGTLDGQGHTISNLYINRSVSDLVGLFSTLGEDSGQRKGGKIINLGLLNVDITGRYYTGGLVGNYDSPFWYDTGSEISQCYVTGTITGSDQFSAVGGLVGRLRGLIKKSYSYSNVNCYGTSAGGLVGVSDSGQIEDCYARGTIWSNSPNIYAGGLVAYNYGGITNSYSTTLIATREYRQTGGLVGYCPSGGGCDNSFWDIETSGLAQSCCGTGKTTLEMKDVSTFVDAGWSFGIWDIDPTLNSGYPYLIGVEPVEFSNNDIWYVDTNAEGIECGRTWETAFKYLQDALTDPRVQAGDEIRVAQGIYKPDQGYGITCSDRTATFQLINGVAVKGGYKGGDTLTGDERNIKTYQTILSGDLSGNDGNPPNFANYGDNSYHIIMGDYLSETTIIDGFTIIGGNADGTGPYPSDRGGGMYNHNGTPTVTNCIFSYNKANSGGGVFNTFCGDNDGPISGTDEELANFYLYQSSSLKFTNCIFYNNYAGQIGGGGIFHGRSPLELINCVFAGNSYTGIGGGGLLIVGSGVFEPSPYIPRLTNCTFYGNSSGIWISSSNPVVTNCIFWDNGNEISNNTSNPVVTYCDIEGGYLGDGNIDEDPLFADTALLEGPDGKFRTMDDGLRLSENSPCIDTGNDITASDSDILGRPHVDITDPDIGLPGVKSDMGAYEYYPDCEGPFGITVVMAFCNESLNAFDEYYPLDAFNYHLNAYENLVSSLPCPIRSGCMSPGEFADEDNDGIRNAVEWILPFDYAYDHANPPAGISIVEFPRGWFNEDPTLEDFTDNFNRIRAGGVPAHLLLVVDYSISMFEPDNGEFCLNPFPDYPYDAFKEWLSIYFPDTEVKEKLCTFDGDPHEYWLREITNTLTPLLPWPQYMTINGRYDDVEHSQRLGPLSAGEYIVEAYSGAIDVGPWYGVFPNWTWHSGFLNDDDYIDINGIQWPNPSGGPTAFRTQEEAEAYWRGTSITLQIPEGGYIEGYLYDRDCRDNDGSCTVIIFKE